MRRRVLEWALWAFAALCLALVMRELLSASLFQSAARAELLAPSGSGESRTSGGEGAPLALLEIERLDLSVVVAEGTSERVLRQAAGRWRGGATFGANGNVTVAAHRDTFFRPLEKLREGDHIRVRLPRSSSGAERTETYEVVWTMIVDPSNTVVTEPTAEPALTLVTCYPFRFVGPAPQRFVARARLVAVEGGESALG